MNSGNNVFTKWGKKQSSKELTQDLRDASGLSVDPSPVRRSLNRNGLSEKGGCQQAKYLKYANLHKDWTLN